MIGIFLYYLYWPVRPAVKLDFKKVKFQQQQNKLELKTENYSFAG